MAERPSHNFGKRRLAPLPSPSTPAKRSSHVALLMAGTMAVGGTAYALIPRDNCQPNSPGMAAPASPQVTTNCSARSGSASGGHGGSWSRSSYFSGSGDSGSSGTTSSGTSRGGFGGSGRGGSGGE
jgi:hypothetical protein